MNENKQDDRLDEMDEVLDGELRELTPEEKAQDEEAAETMMAGEDTSTGKKGDHLQFAIGMLSGVLLVLVFMGGFLMKARMGQNVTLTYIGDLGKEENLEINYNSLNKKMEEMQYIINYLFLNDVDEELVEEKILDGMMEGLDDPYAVYYTKEEVELLNESTNGEYSGIGATLSQDPDTGIVTVVSCFEGSPALEAGLKSEDRILAINDKEIEDMDLSEVVSRIKTDPGNTITLTIQRDDEELKLEMERRKIEIPTVEGEMLDSEIGYIRLLEFDEVTADQFKNTLEELQKEGMEKLIIDLRDNPGGVLQVVVSMLDEILPEGLIVYTEDKYGDREEYTSDEEHKLEIPLVVLINGNSASASEIFAGAVKDYGIGTLVGETTFGKGIVQSIIPLSDDTCIKLTVAKYYTPKGNDIHEIGIDPDVEIELDLGDAEEYSKDADNQLQKAIEILKEK